MGEQYERAITLHELCKAAQECSRGVGFKKSICIWKIDRMARCEALQSEIKNGRHKTGHGTPFKIYEPKERLITPPRVKDRVWQRSMANNGVYDDMTRGFIYDNHACQKGKGTARATGRIVCALERYYRRHGDNKGYARHLDVRRYFPSTPHGVAKAPIIERVREERFIRYLCDVIESNADERSDEEIAADSMGARGTGLGSQINQLAQLAILDGVDKAVSRLTEFYLRYMDDIILIDDDPQKLNTAAAKAGEMMRTLGLELKDNEGNAALAHGFFFLRRKFKLTGTGKALVLPSREKLSKEHRVLNKLKELLDADEIEHQDVANHYESFIAGLMAMDAGTVIQNMNAYYEKLFGRKPVYRCKKKSKRRLCTR